MAFHLLMSVNLSVTPQSNYNGCLNEPLHLHWLIAKEKSIVFAALFD